MNDYRADRMQSKDERRKKAREYYHANKEKFREIQNAYDKENTQHVGLKFQARKDWDILKKLETVPSKQGYIKGLIREDMERTGFDPGPKPSKPSEMPSPEAPSEPVEPVKTTPVNMSTEEALKAWGLYGG